MSKKYIVLVKIRWVCSATGGAWWDWPYNCLLNICKSRRHVSQGFNKKKDVHKTKLAVHFLHSTSLTITQLSLCHPAVLHFHPPPHRCMGYPGRQSSRLEACWLGRAHPDRAGTLPPRLPQQHLEILVRGCVCDASTMPFLLKETSDWHKYLPLCIWQTHRQAQTYIQTHTHTQLGSNNGLIQWLI